MKGQLNPAGFLATQDLKDRGWTPRLIAVFLGQHDQTRPNGLKMGRRRLPPVKLYTVARVEEAEREDKFLLAQHRAMQARERAEQARAKRQEQRTALLERQTERYTPQIEPLALRKGAVNKARAPHLNGLETFLGEVRRGLSGDKKTALNEREEKELKAALHSRLDVALAAAYAWFPDPNGAKAKGKPDKESKAKPSDWRTWDWGERG